MDVEKAVTNPNRYVAESGITSSLKYLRESLEAFLCLWEFADGHYLLNVFALSIY